MFRILNKKAQSTLEYAILIGVVVAALIAAQTYVKRGFQGKLRQSADDMGEQFSPGYTTYDYTTVTETDSDETVKDGASKTVINNQSSNKTGSEQVAGAESEYWFK